MLTLKVILVRTDLKMGVGKIAAQVGHAVLGAYQRALKKHPHRVTRWEEGGTAKVVLKVKDMEEMQKLADSAEKDGLTVCMIHDAGRTQVGA